LWIVNDNKVYPFAKTILEPFVTRSFFYGKSFPDLLAGQYDNYNTMFNTMNDKQFKSMVQGLLVGQANEDALFLDDAFITHSTKIPVPDINQVKPMAYDGISNSDVMMIKLLAASMDESAPSLPTIMANKQATAREIVIAEEKLREIKSLYNEMRADLWRQKYYLRYSKHRAQLSKAGH
jgi:hypothetical protein